MKKLQLNKKTIASLNKDSLQVIKGGGSGHQSRDPRCSGFHSFDPQCPDYSEGVECGCPTCIYDCHTGSYTHFQTEIGCGGPGPSFGPAGCPNL